MSRLVSLVVILIAAPLFAVPPTDAEIQQAIRDLGDKRFAVREKASKFLWQAGATAEAALKEAEKTKDPETARRARDIVERFSWGLFPDTPKQVADLINEFRSGDQNVRMAVVAKLVALGRPGFDTIKRLAAHAENEDQRHQIFAQVSTNAQRGVPLMLLANDLAGVEELLDLALAADHDVAPTNYAAFQYLRGTVPAAIKKWETDWSKTKTKLAGGVLIHLYRTNGDFASALKIAEEIKDDVLIDVILWEWGNWKALAARAGEVGPREGLSLGARAGYRRLAGDTAGLETTLAEIRKLGEGSDRYEIRSAAEALLLNGRPDEVMALLVDKKNNVALAFELLCARMKYKEAFELAEVRALEGEDSFYLELRRARVMYLLGQKDQALKLYDKLGEDLQQIGQMNTARELIKSLARQGQKVRAAEICANYLTVLDSKGVYDGRGPLLEPLFDADAESADVWWHFLRQKNKNDTPAASMKTVRALFAGQQVGNREEWANELAESKSILRAPRPPMSDPPPAPPPPQPGQPIPPDPERVSGTIAAAVVMLAAGNDKRADEYFAKAANDTDTTSEAAIRYGDFLSQRKKFKDAANYYARAAKLDPSSALALFLHGWALTQSGDAKEGKRLSELSHWLPLGSEQARGDFAQELEKRGFIEDARRERDLVLTIGWYRYWHVGNTINHASRMAAQKKDYAKAVVLLEKGIIGCMRMGASFVEPHAYLMIPQAVTHYRVRQLLDEHKIDEALKLLRSGLDVLPGNMEMVIEAVPILEKFGRKKDADELYARVRAVFDQICRDYPDSAFAHNSAAWLAANCRRELDTALTHAQTAVKLEPKSAGYLDTLAEVHFRRGEKEKATEWIKKCVELEPKKPYYRKQLQRFAKGDISSDVPEQEDD